MKKYKIIIINRASTSLFVEYQRYGHSELEKLKIRKRKVLKLISGNHIFSMGYEGMNLQLNAAIKGIKDHDVIPSIRNPKVMGVKLLVSNSKKRLKLRCNDAPAVSSIIENLS